MRGQLRLLRAILSVALVSGCASATGRPSPSAPLDLPLGRPDAALKASVLEAITAGTAASPRPSWYSSLHMLGGLPDVAVEGGVLYVIAELPDTAAGRQTAGVICLGMASLLAREGVIPVDVSHLAVGNLSNATLAACLPAGSAANPFP